MDAGVGTLELTRWYYDIGSNRCQSFVFRGYQSNQNNFMNERLCEQACKSLSNCEFGRPFIQNNMPKHCAPELLGSCPNQYYCQVSNDDPTNSICCPMASQSQLQKRYKSTHPHGIE